MSLPIDLSAKAIAEAHLSSAKKLRFKFWPEVAHTRTQRVGVFPYPLKNPFLPLMYAQTSFEVVALPSLWRGLRLARLNHLDALHIQFENQFHRHTRFEPNLSPKEASTKAIKELSSYKKTGKPLIWTLHDSADHYDAEFSEYRRQMRQFLAQNSDLIHVFSQAGAEHASSVLGADPSRIEVVKHPSYIGAYGSLSKLQRPPRQRRFLCFGTILPFKGIDEFLIKAGETNVDDRCGKITVSGAYWPDISPNLSEFIPSNRNIELNYGFVAEQDVPNLFANADFIVVNYKRALTSGVAALAMTFGKPVIGTNQGGIAEAIAPENRKLLYDIGTTDGLNQVISRACYMKDEEHLDLQQKCLDFAEQTHPCIQSRRLENALSKHCILKKS
ncbi:MULTISPECIES: glycosyltransferase [Pseudomonadota]|jgi:glycosyltransferase involved in cell wall biosynthesis|uniref:glycosyltransferase n=1 Tax=Pseudomonadota TaxID=1224 RepID=UPI003A8E6BCF